MSNLVNEVGYSAIFRTLPLPRGRRRWPALVAPESKTLEGLALAIHALVNRLRIQSREAGEFEDSFVTIADLVALGVIDQDGKLLSTRVKELEGLASNVSD